MAEDSENTVASGLPDRRARLEALKAKRQETITPVQAPQSQRPNLPSATAGPVRPILPGRGGKQMRKGKILFKLYKLMAGKPGDESGYIEATPFTNDAVARVMDMLRKRSEDPSMGGTKIAKSALTYLEPRSGETEGPGGCSVERLQGLARGVEQMRARRNRDAE